MTIYILIYSFLALLIFTDKSNINITAKKMIIIFAVIILTIFRGLRWETGTDWEQYYEVFIFADWSNIFSFDRGLGNMEPGYVFLNTLIANLGGNYTVFLLITNLYILLSYARFSIKNSNFPIYIFVLIIFSTQFFPVRIGLAVAIIIWGLDSLSKKNNVRIIIYTILASTIHSSAIIFIPIYFICRYKKTPTILSVGMASFFFVLSKSNMISVLLTQVAFVYSIIGEHNATKFEHYLDYTDSNIGGIGADLNSIIFIITLAVFGASLKKMESKNKLTNYSLLYNMYLVFVLMGIIFSAENLENLKRLQNYFMFSFPILFSSFIIVYKNRYPKLSFIFTLIFLIYLLFRFYTLCFSGYPDLHFPYKSIFD